MTGWIVGVFLALFIAKWVVETGLLQLNLAHTAAERGVVPAALAGRIDPARAGRSADYTLQRGRLGLIESALGAALVLAVLFSGFLPWLEQGLAGLRFMGRPLEGIHLSAGFLIVLALLSGIAGLPFTLYRTFVIEERFGFNRQTWRTWLVDRLKGLAIGIVLGLPFLYGVLAFMAFAGSTWWLWVFAFIIGFQLLLVVIYPTWIAPIFNKFTPLQDGELKSRLEALADHAGFRTKGLSIMDASRRTGHSNAFFTGLGRAKRIVLFDTLVEKMSPDETLAVLAHEIGHFRAHHVKKRLAIGVVVTLLTLYVLSLLIEWPPLFHAFGFTAPSHHAALILLMLCGGAFTFYLAPLSAWYSRRHEYQADAYSVGLAGLPEALAGALVRLSDQNLANLNPHRWYSAYYYSHPTLAERVEAIKRLGPESRTAHGAMGDPAAAVAAQPGAAQPGAKPHGPAPAGEA